MIEAYTYVAKYSDYPCDNKDCKHLSEYIDKLEFKSGTSVYVIKPGTTALYIVIRSTGLEMSDRYCFDCIDKVYQKLMPAIDKSLWVLK